MYYGHHQTVEWAQPGGGGGGEALPYIGFSNSLVWDRV